MRTHVGTVRLVSTETWREIAESAAPHGRIDAAAFSPEGSLLATLAATKVG